MDKTRAKAHWGLPRRSKQGHMQGGEAVPQRLGLVLENGRAEGIALFRQIVFPFKQEKKTKQNKQQTLANWNDVKSSYGIFH